MQSTCASASAVFSRNSPPTRRGVLDATYKTAGTAKHRASRGHDEQSSWMTSRAPALRHARFRDKRLERQDQRASDGLQRAECIVPRALPENLSPAHPLSPATCSNVPPATASIAGLSARRKHAAEKYFGLHVRFCRKNPS